MNILVIDTSTPVEIVAAASGKSVSDQIRLVSVSHSATLFGSIDKALKEISIEPEDLNLIGVGIGPGSFTGIRIAVTTARMLSQILDLPLVGINSQLLYAASASEEAGKNDYILIAFDAKKGKVFGALYQKNEELVEIREPGDYKIEDLLIGINPAGKTLLIGDGCKKFKEEIELKVADRKYLPVYLPSAETICNLAKRIYSGDPDMYNDFNNIIPFYSRPSDAELNKKMK